MACGTLSDAGAHHLTLVVAQEFIGRSLRDRVPVSRREIHLKPLGHLACRVLQTGPARLKFVESRECGIKVTLVEDFAAVNQIAVDRENGDFPPFGGETLLRSPARRMGNNTSVAAQPIDSLDVDLDVRRKVPRGL